MEGRRVKRVARAGAVCAGLALAVWGADMHPALDVRALGHFASGLFPPDLSPAFLNTVALATVRTLSIAIAGTVLAVAIGFPLGALATPALWRRGPLLSGESQGPGAALSFVAAGLARFFRAVPDVVWAIFFVVGFGLGPLPGALALGINCAGVLARVYADLLEGVPPGPVLALHATGASRIQALVAGIAPQAMPSLLAYTLYAFECNVRAAAVLGLVGAGGLGQEIGLSLRLFEYGQVTTLLAATMALVLATDALSRFFRKSANRRRGSRKVVGGVLIAVAFASFADTGFFSAPAPVHMLRFAAQLAPDLSRAFLATTLIPLRETVAISVLGTALGICLAAALAVPATAGLTLNDGDGASVAGRLFHGAARSVLALLRSIPELVWALLCILAFGVGAFSGAVALGLHTGGVLGKLFAEALEEVPPRPVEELRAAGATRLQRLVWAMAPQARETLLSYALLRWETNLRLATVVGLVGGGGLGLALYNDVQLGFYSRASTLVLIIYALVMVTDGLADRLRGTPSAAPVPPSALELLSAR
jgi:phosphonate transport system permease protein